MARRHDRGRERLLAAARRYESRDDIRDEKRKLIKTGKWTQAEEAARIRTRLNRKGMRGEAVDAVLDDAKGSKADARRASVVLERVLGRSQFQGVGFLSGGSRAARAVARIVIRSDGAGVDGYGTGFLVSPQLMLTNNHVLSSLRTAQNSVAQFDYYERPNGTLNTPLDFTFDPDRFFVTDEDLDFTLVALNPEGLNGEDLSGRFWLPFIRESGKLLIGEPVNIIQHPDGDPMQIAIRENPVVDVVDDFLHYKSDTLQGSSGAPVCNDDWELAALHHAGVPRRDENGDMLLTNGEVWDGGHETYHQIDWIANEGVRISRIVSYLDETRLNAQARRLYTESFELPSGDVAALISPSDCKTPARDLDPESPAGPRPVVPPTPAPATSAPIGPQDAIIELPQQGGVPLMSQPVSNGLSFYFKVTIEQMHAAPAPAAQAGTMVTTVPAGTATRRGASGGVSGEPDGAAHQLAGKILDERRGREKKYYDKDADRNDREAYYRDIDFEASADDLFHDLSTLISRTHKKKLSYKTARLKHLYPWIDLRPGSLELFSIYSNDEMGAQETIRTELESMARARMGTKESYSVADLESLLNDEEDDEDAQDLTFEAIHGSHNCEHVVPQSWFNKAQPMKADLHHLFACQSRCNSFRSNIPYYDFDPTEESTMTDCGRRESNKFEPSYNHGVVARATLYFLLRYPGEIGDEGRELQRRRLPTLLAWHKAQKVNLYELHRNAAIAAVQGNRNPLIDHPELAERIDFERGFG